VFSFQWERWPVLAGLADIWGTLKSLHGWGVSFLGLQPKLSHYGLSARQGYGAAGAPSLRYGAAGDVKFPRKMNFLKNH
jgi:hypothetical protein